MNITVIYATGRKAQLCTYNIAERKNFYAGTAQEHKLFITDKSPRKNVWIADPQGLAAPGYGLCLSAADMAKIGQLCMQNGTWNGQPIISSKWLREMLSPRMIESGTFSGMSYGYLWWIVHPEKSIYAAIGDSGNVIYVAPHEKTVVAVSSCFRPAVRDRIDFIEHIIVADAKRKNAVLTAYAQALHLT